jgi:adenine-specific DNA-methyltransferase
MSRETLKDLMLQTPDLNAERIAKLKELFPDLFNGEGQLDEDELRQLIDPQSARGNERYEFRWFGKSQAKRDAFTPGRATLVFDEGRSVNPQAAGNLIIEGENLEVLKLLLRAYREEIKCIYIDPPYNTGKDFIYSDNYTEARKPYWEQTGVTESGVRVDTNADTHGRFHSNWMNMMYSRLLVARQLLKPDGVIFISIDDNEVHNLRRLCDEVFGEENFINLVTVATKVAAGASGGGADKRLKKNVELLLMYAKNYDESGGFANAFTEAPLFSVIKSMKENGESWKYTSILTHQGTRRKIKTIEDGEGRPVDIYLREGIQRTTIKAVCAAESISEELAYKKYFAQIFHTPTRRRVFARASLMRLLRSRQTRCMKSNTHLAPAKTEGKRCRTFTSATPCVV